MLRKERSREARAVAVCLARAIADSPSTSDWDPEALARVIARLYRWDARAVLALGAALRRPVPRTFIEESDGAIQGAVAWSPGRRVGWIAALGIGPGTGGVGVRNRLLERCAVETGRHQRRALVVPGSILPEIRDPSESLSTIGFESLGTHRRHVLDRAQFPTPLPSPRTTRALRRSDGDRLTRFARAGRLPKLERIEPVQRSDLVVSSWVASALGSTTRSFVHDGPEGADAYARVTRSAATTTAHLAVVLDPDATETAGQAVLDDALAWCRHRGATRAVVEAPEGSRHLEALFERSGFEPRERWETWARAIDGAS